MEGDGGEVALFQDVVFAIIPTDLTDDQINSVETALTTSGGQSVPLRETDQQIDNDAFDNVTHIIATSVDFPQYERALELGIAIVKPSWVSQSVLKKRIAATRQHTPDPAQFFHDVVVTFAGLPEGDVENLIAGVIALGGQHSPNLSKLVTHIVTVDDNARKCQLAIEKMPRVKRVLPHWFDDCFKLGKAISELPYMFPDPEILRSDLNGTSVKGAQSPELDGAISVTPKGEPSSSPPSSPTSSRKNLNALVLQKIYLSNDLQISTHLRTTLKKLCTHAGAVIVHSVAESSLFIGQYRDGPEYEAASRSEEIVVANLAWLFHVINYNRYVSPMRKLFHYPIPREPISGFENMKISISNYSGDARVYVENLIRYCGAEYTKTMKQDNTHLVAAHMHGEKCEAAQEWNVSIVNHLWLEESYAKCAYQTVANPKYTHFPSRTNLGEVAGQTALDMKCVEKVYFPKAKTPHRAQTNSPRKAVPASSTMTTSMAHGGPRAALADDKVPDCPTPIAEADEIEVDAAPTTIKRPRGRPPKSALATPRFADDEKENTSPSVTSTGRAAKNKALSSIHSQAPDITAFQKEMKRKGGVVHGGRRASIAREEESPAPARRTSKKRPSDEYDVTAVGSALSDGETQAEPSRKQTKKAKLAATLPPVKHRMMVTGDDRWQNDSRKESADKNTLRSIGVLLTTDPKEVDILVATRLLRTRKFVCALAGAPLVVDTTFLDAALKQKKLINDPPMLRDVDGEERMGFTLESSLERAKVNDRKLFNGWSIFVTKDVKGGFETYKDIVTLNGGAALLYSGRTGLVLPKRRIEGAGAESQNQGGAAEYDFVYLVSGESEAEIKLWSKFRDMAHKQGLKARVVGTEWLVCAALSQQVEWKTKWELHEDKAMSQRSG